MSIAESNIPLRIRKRPEAAVPGFPVARITVPEYLFLVDAGFFGSRRVELWEGWVVDRMPHGSLPATLIMLIVEWIRERLSAGSCHRIQLPIELAESCPEPDIAIVRGKITDYVSHHPKSEDVQLLIEVSDSTLASDRETKGRMYAQAKIAEYWIINCENRQIEVYTDPQSTGKSPRYRHLTTYLAGQSVPVQIAGKKLGEIAVNELFGVKK